MKALIFGFLFGLALGMALPWIGQLPQWTLMVLGALAILAFLLFWAIIHSVAKVENEKGPVRWRGK